MSTVEQFSYYDEAHWYKVKEARKRQGIVSYTEVGKVLSDHPLVGQTLEDPETGRSYFVERIKKNWQKGWFVQATLVRDGMKIFCVVENQSSTCEDILRSHASFKEMFAESLQH